MQVLKPKTSQTERVGRAAAGHQLTEEREAQSSPPVKDLIKKRDRKKNSCPKQIICCLFY